MPKDDGTLTPREMLSQLSRRALPHQDQTPAGLEKWLKQECDGVLGTPPELVKFKRGKVRYWCFRFQTAEEGGAKATGAPNGLRKFVEAHKAFGVLGGWKNFAKSWDVDDDDPWAIRLRAVSIWREWNELLRRIVPVLPGVDEHQ